MFASCLVAGVLSTPSPSAASQAASLSKSGPRTNLHSKTPTFSPRACSSATMSTSSAGLMLTTISRSCELLLEAAVGVICSVAMVPKVVATYLQTGAPDNGDQFGEGLVMSVAGELRRETGFHRAGGGCGARLEMRGAWEHGCPHLALKPW